jgi:hypothetical protein
MRNGENYNSRRNFFKGIAGSLLLLSFLEACKEKVISLGIRLSGTNHILGHRLRAKDFPKPTSQIHIPYLIVGGGITGLSAARQFAKIGISDFLLLELEDQLGGNASNGENKYSKYPLGAHYLPLPNRSDKELLQFLEEEKIITGYSGGFPVFDELQLAFAPDERLFYKNSWQEGLVPKWGISASDDRAFKDFFGQMDIYRNAKGVDGKYLFDIPLSQCSDDEESKKLDALTMKKWLQDHGYEAAALLAYVDYCCRDDFGLGVDFVSAWAGIHYFSGRKHDTRTDRGESVLTWPEGNARLASHLRKYSENKALKNYLVYDVTIRNQNVIVKAFDDVKRKSVEIIADKVIMATPQFVNGYIFPERKSLADDFHYAPWLLATLTVSSLSDNDSFPLSWDNVIYGGKGLGYIYDQHQSVKQVQEKQVITYYRAFSTDDTKKARRIIYQKPEHYWKQQVFDDLRTAHPNIEELTEQMDIHLLGHGMISPVPGFIFGNARQSAKQPIGGKIYFAHSDLSGISVFEEAFHQGINAVNNLLNDTTMDS